MMSELPLSRLTRDRDCPLRSSETHRWNQGAGGISHPDSVEGLRRTRG